MAVPDVSAGTCHSFITRISALARTVTPLCRESDSISGVEDRQ